MPRNTAFTERMRRRHRQVKMSTFLQEIMRCARGAPARGRDRAAAHGTECAVNAKKVAPTNELFGGVVVYNGGRQTAHTMSRDGSAALQADAHRLYENDDVVVLGMDVPPHGWPPEHAALLDDAEARMCRELRSDGARALFVASRALLRRALEGATGIEARSWRFARDALGRPSVAGDAGLPTPRISLTHAAGAVAVAVAPERSVGVDLEPLTSAPQALAATVAVTAPERRWLDTLAAVDQRVAARAALALWTQKEAYAKMRGLGAELDFGTLDVLDDPPSDAWLLSKQVHLAGAPFALGVALERGQA
jgi:phosphopantetheinyl transferase